MASEGVDVVVLTALELEYQAALAVNAGAQSDRPWVEEHRKGLPVAFRSFEGAGGQPLRVAVARGSGMGMAEALAVLIPLVDELSPRCIAMCGVCAGRPGKTALGDVIAAERLFVHDAGKQLHEGVRQDLETYSLRRDWKVALERFDPVARFGHEAWFLGRPVPYEWQENWVLAKLREGVKDPSALPECERFCPRWGEVVEALWARGDLKPGERKLTAQGRKRITTALIVHKNALPDLSPAGGLMPFRLHVAPMGSGSKVVEDEAVWGFVSEAMRKTLGLEMEAAALGQLAELRKHTATLDALVMKGVMDFADHGRDDHFKQYAARASAECLLAFLHDRLPEALKGTRRHEPPQAPPATGVSEGRSKPIPSAPTDGPLHVALVPGYTPEFDRLLDTLKVNKEWSGAQIIQEGPYRIESWITRTFSDRPSRVVVFVDLGFEQHDHSFLDDLVDFIKMTRERGRQLDRKPIFVLFSGRNALGCSLERLPVRDRVALSHYFSLKPDVDASSLSRSCSELFERIQMDWLRKPKSSLSPL